MLSEWKSHALRTIIVHIMSLSIDEVLVSVCVQLLLGFGKLDEVLLSDLVDQVGDNEDLMADLEGEEESLTDEEVQVGYGSTAARWLTGRVLIPPSLPSPFSSSSNRQWKVWKTASPPSLWGVWEHGVGSEA